METLRVSTWASRWASQVGFPGGLPGSLFNLDLVRPPPRQIGKRLLTASGERTRRCEETHRVWHSVKLETLRQTLRLGDFADVICKGSQADLEETWKRHGSKTWIVPWCPMRHAEWKARGLRRDGSESEWIGEDARTKPHRLGDREKRGLVNYIGKRC